MIFNGYPQLNQCAIYREYYSYGNFLADYPAISLISFYGFEIYS